MYISRLLALPLLMSICGAPIVAQSSPATSPLPQLLPTRPQDEPAGIRFDQFRWSYPWDGVNPSYIVPPLVSRVTTLKRECYYLRTYRVTRDDPKSDVTRPADSSICQPAARFDLKDAGDSPAQLSFP